MFLFLLRPPAPTFLHVSPAKRKIKLVWPNSSSYESLHFSLCNFWFSRKSRSLMLFKKGVLKNFTIFTGKHLCCCFFIINLQFLFNKETPTQVFSCEYCHKVLRTAFFIEHLRWLPLNLRVSSQASKMELCAKIVNGSKHKIISTKSFILDVW